MEQVVSYRYYMLYHENPETKEHCFTQLLDFTVHHRAPPLSKTGNNISISTLQILLKVVTFAQASK